MAWFYWLGAAIAFGTVCFALFWTRRRRRILALEWPARFRHWSTMCGYSKIFLRKHGWRVRSALSPPADFIINKPSFEAGVTFLVERDYWSRIPDHFLTRLAVGVVKRGRPMVLVTDFGLDEEVVARSNKRDVYPVYYKDLGKLDSLLPTTKQFRQS